MFKTILSVFALAFVFQIVLPDDAEARRGFKWRSGSSKRVVPVIVPIPRNSTDVVFVKKLPYKDAFKHEGRHFDLGYKHGWFGTGKWVGYFRSAPRGYVELNQKVVKEKLLPALGVTLADVPGKKQIVPEKKTSRNASATDDAAAGVAVGGRTRSTGLAYAALPLLFIALVFVGLVSRVRKSLHSAAQEKRTRSFMDAPVAVDEPLMMPEKNARIEDSIQKALRQRQEAQRASNAQNIPEGPAKSEPRQQVTRIARQPVRAGQARAAFGRR